MTSLSLPPPRKIASSRTTMPLSGEVTLAVVSQQSIPNNHNNHNNNNNAQTSTNKPQCAPSYEERCRAAAELSKLTPEQRKQSNRKLFVPRSLDDFDDGGAFPEIHVAQYPRHMGNPHLKKQGTTGGSHINSSSRAIVNVEVDRDGEISYDMIVKGGTNSDKKVFSRHEDLIGGPPKEEDIALPDDETEEQVFQRTQLALQKLLASKTALDKPSGSAMVNAETSKNIEEKTQFIKYTPRPDAPGYNPAAAQRVIQMVPAQVDPMMPPKHKHAKAPRGPAEDPVPVLHAPPQKLTKEERDKWNVPACISNWKNTRGYTIPLDKRLAADGRGLREHTINSNFATLSESLYVAERHARTEVRMRSQVQKKLVLQEKDHREEELRQLANQARLERSGMASSNTAAAASKPSGGEDDNTDDDDEIHVSDASDDKKGARRRHENDNEDDDDRHDETDEQVAARQREKLRMERKRERERELRMENNMELKKKKLEEDRDVSEKIALGVHTGSGGLAVGQVDARLYNQSAGMDSGFGAEDEYNTYSAPLFDRQGVSSASIYRPTRGETEYNADESYDKLVEGATTKFQPGKGFAGAEGGTGMSAGPRSAPVQFERDKK